MFTASDTQDIYHYHITCFQSNITQGQNMPLQSPYTLCTLLGWISFNISTPLSDIYVESFLFWYAAMDIMHNDVSARCHYSKAKKLRQKVVCKHHKL